MTGFLLTLAFVAIAAWAVIASCAAVEAQDRAAAEAMRADAAEARLTALRHHASPDPWALRRADEDVRGMGT